MVASALWLLGPLPASAQTMTATEQTEVTQTIRRGQLLYAFDQAAWRATDRMLADAKAQGRMDQIRDTVESWVVHPRDDGLLEVLFFDRTLDAPNAVYTAQLGDDGRRVVSGAFAAPATAITEPVTLGMIRAQRAALGSLQRTPIQRCKAAPFNIATLPPVEPDGPVPVYILTPQTDGAHVPFGGHVRIMVTADGTVAAPHAFAKSCLELTTKAPEGVPVAIGVTQLVDPLPTEIAVFTMLAAKVPLHVITQDQRTWRIDAPGGKVSISLLPGR